MKADEVLFLLVYLLKRKVTLSFGEGRGEAKNANARGNLPAPLERAGERSIVTFLRKKWDIFGIFF